MEMVKTHEQAKAEINYLLKQQWPNIVTAYRKSAYDLSVTLKLGLEGGPEICKITTGLEYYPEPKTKIKNNPVKVDERQRSLPLNTNNNRKGNFHEILFRNFDDLRAILAKLRWMQDEWKRDVKRETVFKKF